MKNKQKGTRKGVRVRGKKETDKLFAEYGKRIMLEGMKRQIEINRGFLRHCLERKIVSERDCRKLVNAEEKLYGNIEGVLKSYEK